MTLDSLVGMAKENGASDLHLEPGLPTAIRVRGALRMIGESMDAKVLLEIARAVVGPEQWPGFLDRRSADLSKTIQGVRCRINVFQSSRGVAFAVRLLSSFQATLEKLNLHPDLKRFVSQTHGLILVSGATGSGKSSTLAALIQEINLTESRHVITVESPIEYKFRPNKAFIQQREVGRDTPSFEQALLDALREDPDVLMVGEMRDPETMRLTLNASETGHLVLATVHSSTCVEALQRVVAAFPSEIQNTVAAQLADCLVAVISQRLQFRSDLNIRVPECEILVPTHSIKNFIRNREFFRIISVLETGADHGMWTFQRYRTWMEKRTKWFIPDSPSELGDDDVNEAPIADAPLMPPMPSVTTRAKFPATASLSSLTQQHPKSGRIEIEPVEGGLETLLKKLE